MAFQTAITIKEAIDHIHNNRYLLPAIQREFVWWPHQMERLFDSLMRGYPIGSFLFWRVDPETAKNYSFYQFITNSWRVSAGKYELADKARAMGWNEVEVIDEDLGRSGASALQRTGFQRLVAEVGLGHCGAIFSLEASRMARNNADWYQLLDLCALAQTLLVDSEAVYDPRLSNDRLLLGLKGALSEAELGLIFRRAHQGLLSKAQHGELYRTVPIGYLRTRDDRVEKDPDLRVQESVQGVLAREYQRNEESG